MATHFQRELRISTGKYNDFILHLTLKQNYATLFLSTFIRIFEYYMAENNIEQRFSAVETGEGAPSLGAVKVKARTVGEAMDKAGGAGQAELDWVLANPKEARKMLKGNNLFYFPDAADGDFVPFVVWLDGEFWQFWDHRDISWNSNDRVVQVG